MRPAVAHLLFGWAHCSTADKKKPNRSMAGFEFLIKFIAKHHYGQWCSKASQVLIRHLLIRRLMTSLVVVLLIDEEKPTSDQIR